MQEWHRRNSANVHKTWDRTTLRDWGYAKSLFRRKIFKGIWKWTENLESSWKPLSSTRLCSKFLRSNEIMEDKETTNWFPEKRVFQPIFGGLPILKLGTDAILIEKEIRLIGKGDSDVILIGKRDQKRYQLPVWGSVSDVVLAVALRENVKETAFAIVTLTISVEYTVRNG